MEYRQRLKKSSYILQDVADVEIGLKRDKNGQLVGKKVSVATLTRAFSKGVSPTSFRIACDALANVLRLKQPYESFVHLDDKIKIPEGLCGNRFAGDWWKDAELPPDDGVAAVEETHTNADESLRRSAQHKRHGASQLSPESTQQSGSVLRSTRRVPRWTPPPPQHRVERQDELARLEQLLLHGEKSVIGITGMGGIGKTVLASECARLESVRKRFSDGVIWLTVGQEPDVDSLLVDALSRLDESLHPIVPSAQEQFARLAANGNWLLILDDVWTTQHARAFDIPESNCRTLITTRDSKIVNTELKAAEHRIGGFTDDQCLALLREWADHTVEDAAVVRDLISACGHLPLAIAVCGAMIHDHCASQRILEALHDSDLEYLDGYDVGYTHPGVLRAFSVGYEYLRASGERHEQIASDVLLAMAVFPKGYAFPEPVAISFACHRLNLSVRNIEKALNLLDRRSFLLIQGEAPHRRVSLHDLQHDFMQIRYQRDCGDLDSIHRQILKSYQENCPDGWHAGPNDGYFFQHLAYHLKKADQPDELRELLLNFDWLQARLNATDVGSLVDDFRHAARDHDLSLLRDTIRLSSHALSRDKKLLRSQLHGRLLGIDNRTLEAFRVKLEKTTDHTWLCSLSPSLTGPGGPLLRTLSGHAHSVNGVAVTPEGTRAVSASRDKTVKVWELEGGGEPRTLAGHTDPVNGVTVTPDGRWAVSASADKTLKVWDLESGAELKTLVGHTQSVNAVAVTPEGRWAVSASMDKTLKVWDLESGAELQTLVGHDDSVNGVAVSPDGRQAVSASGDHTLKVWDLESGAELQTLVGHADSVNGVAVTPDGRRAVTASGDHTLKVWDLESGAELQTLVGHADSVNGVAVTPDGKRAISASQDHMLKLWDFATGYEMAAYASDHSLLCCAAVVNRRIFVVGDAGGRVHFVSLRERQAE